MVSGDRMLLRNWLVGIQIVLFLTLSLSFSGCIEEEITTSSITSINKNSINEPQEPEVIKGPSGEIIIAPDGIQVRDWNIAVDRILITIENTGDTDIFVSTIGADVSFDDDVSTFRHYEATMNSELGTNEEKIITIRIHKLSDWEKPHLLSIEII